MVSRGALMAVISTRQLIFLRSRSVEISANCGGATSAASPVGAAGGGVAAGVGAGDGEEVAAGAIAGGRLLGSWAWRNSLASWSASGIADSGQSAIPSPT